MVVIVNTPMQSCEDCKWFSLDADQIYLDNDVITTWFCRHHLICENAIEKYKAEEEKNDSCQSV